MHGRGVPYAAENISNATLEIMPTSVTGKSADAGVDERLKLAQKTFGRLSSSDRESLSLKKHVEARASELLAFVQQEDFQQLNDLELNGAIARLTGILAPYDAMAATTYVPNNLHKQLEAGSNFDRADLARFAAQVNRGINMLLFSGQWRLLAPRDLARIVSWGPMLGRPSQFRLISGSFFELSLWRAQELLAGVVHRVRECRYQKCGKLCLAIRGKQYCSKQCAQNEHARRFRASLNPKDRREYNRLSYLRKLQRNKRYKYLAGLQRDEPENAEALRVLFGKSKRSTRTNHAPEAKSRKSKALTIKKKH